MDEELITENKLLRARIAELEARLGNQLSLHDARFHQLAENIQEVFWIADVERGQISYVSPGYEAVWGRTLESFYTYPTSMVDAIHPDDRRRLMALSYSHGLGERTEVEYRILHPDGSIRWIWDRGFPIKDERGRIVSVAGVATDITERKLMEEALYADRSWMEQHINERTTELAAVNQRLEELTRLQSAILNSASFSVISTTVEGLITSFNAAAERMLAYSAAEVIGQLIVTAFHDSAELVQRARVLTEEYGFYVAPDFSVFALPAHNGIDECEWTYLRKDGGRIPVQLTVTAIRDSAGAVIGFLGIAADMTGRRQAEQALRASEEQYRALVETSLQGVLVYQDDRVVFVNPAAEQLFGHPAEVLLGRSPKQIVEQLHPADRDQIVRRFEAFHAGQSELAQVQYRLFRPDGSVRRVVSAARPILFSGRPALMTMLLDMTALMQAEDRLRLQARMLDTVGQSVIATDMQSRISYWNRFAERLYGWSAQEMLGQDARELIGTDFSVEQAEAISVALRNNQLWSGELWMCRKDDTRFPALITNSALLDEDGRLSGVISISVDITPQKQVEETLRRSRDELSVVNAELARAARLKDEFLANMSHELRTPLNSVLGLAEALQEQIYGPLTERQARAVKNIGESGRHLLTLINDILDLSKIDAGKLVLALEPLDVAEVCHAALRMVRQHALARNQHVSLKLDDKVDVILGDERRLKQILVNLLSNAVKFTAEGGTIGLELYGDSEARTLQFTVWDTGIGIAPEDMQHLFQPFVQIDGGLARHYEGSGLGLALVSRLVELHGGSVAVESSPGNGSRFIVTLPWRLPARMAQSGTALNGHVALPVNSSPARILVVDDNESSITTLADYLTARGFTVLTARNGAEALERATADQPALVLMDIQMPGMDGLEATRRLRANPVTAAIPVIALTALAMPGDRERCLEAGANDYFSKPVRLAGLVERLRHMLG